MRENLYCGSGNSNNATYTYTYDSWGNILTKKQHAYSTGSAGPGVVVANYGYTNSTWKDQLTSYNNQSITYDAMGNPISYLGATLSWNGKQLTGYSKGGTNVTYAYNEDGLRTQKTYNGTTTDYYYNGSVLIGMQSGNTVQRFSYDAQGKVVSVNYNGTEYYYLRNAQGDIVKLIDGSKNTVVEYTYDSWGKLLATTGSLATSLGANQPFRYRGYVYDTETQWYYLQSRYYNPEICRFISSDVDLTTDESVIGHNTYAYCGNNPTNRIDEEGESWEDVKRAWSWVKGAANDAWNWTKKTASNAYNTCASAYKYTKSWVSSKVNAAKKWQLNTTVKVVSRTINSYYSLRKAVTTAFQLAKISGAYSWKLDRILSFRMYNILLKSLRNNSL